MRAPKFTFKPETGLYYDEDGRALSPAALRRIQAESEGKHKIALMALVIAYLLWRMQNGLVPEAEMLTPQALLELVPEGVRLQVGTLAKRLGPVSSRDFQIQMQEQITLAHNVNAVLGGGGFAAMTMGLWAYAERRASLERAYSQRLNSQIERGLVSAPQAVNRTSQYAESPYATMQGSTRERERARGTIEARRILDPQAEHCEDCPKFASSEWQPIQDVVPIGESACRARCRCWIEYRREARRVGPPEPPAPHEESLVIPEPEIITPEAA